MNQASLPLPLTATTPYRPSVEIPNALVWLHRVRTARLPTKRDTKNKYSTIRHESVRGKRLSPHLLYLGCHALPWFRLPRQTKKTSAPPPSFFLSVTSPVVTRPATGISLFSCAHATCFLTHFFICSIFHSRKWSAKKTRSARADDVWWSSSRLSLSIRRFDRPQTKQNWFWLLTKSPDGSRLDLSRRRGCRKSEDRAATNPSAWKIDCSPESAASFRIASPTIRAPPWQDSPATVCTIRFYWTKYWTLSSRASRSSELMRSPISPYPRRRQRTRWCCSSTSRSCSNGKSR